MVMQQHCLYLALVAEPSMRLHMGTDGIAVNDKRTPHQLQHASVPYSKVQHITMQSGCCRRSLTLAAAASVLLLSLLAMTVAGGAGAAPGPAAGPGPVGGRTGRAWYSASLSTSVTSSAATTSATTCTSTTGEQPRPLYCIKVPMF